MSFTNAGVRVWDSTEAASIHAASQAMGASLNERIVSTFATTTARDAAFAGLTSAQKAGIVCWIVNREGHSYWSPTDNGWRWVGVNRPIYDGTAGGNVDVNGNTPTIALDPSGTTLPAGNRRIQISARANAMPITNSPLKDSYPRILVEGTGYSGQAQTFCPGTGIAVSVYHFDYATMTGPLNMRMQVFNVGPSGGWMRFSNIQLTLTDLGPIG